MATLDGQGYEEARSENCRACGRRVTVFRKRKAAHSAPSIALRALRDGYGRGAREVRNRDNRHIKKSLLAKAWRFFFKKKWVKKGNF